MSDKMSGLDRANMWDSTAGQFSRELIKSLYNQANSKVLARDIVKVLHIDLLQVYVN